MSKRILSIILFSWLSMAASTAFAQQKTDTADTFRFVPQEDTFYLPREDNPQESVQSLSPTISQLSLRANLLRWATLTPDLGLEWRFFLFSRFDGIISYIRRILSLRDDSFSYFEASRP